MSKIDDLMDKREIREVEVDLEKVEKSLEIAENKLFEAKNLYSAEFYETAFLTLYTSMFHAARSLLYRDGYQDKGHFAVYSYLLERYFDKIPKSLLNSFNEFKNNRHEILYGFEGFHNPEEVEVAILDCEEFLEEVKRIHEEA
jgi:uncharacterized protein (UPF0332 family)